MIANTAMEPIIKGNLLINVIVLLSIFIILFVSSEIVNYYLQNVGVKSIIIAYISNLPISIKSDSTILATSVRWAKLAAGPTVPIPGPIPAIAVATELAAVSPSNPVKARIMLPIINITK